MNTRITMAMALTVAVVPLAQAQAQEAPQIYAGSNGEIEATYSNNCVVYYDANGNRRESNPNCSRNQVSRADTGVAAYRREQGLEGYAGSEAPPGGFGNPGQHYGPPEVVMDGHGRGHVLVGPSCIVYYGRDGDRSDTNQQCSRGERNQADGAMASFRREQGLSEQKTSGYAYGLPVFRLRNGNYQVTTGTGCTVYFRSNGTLLTWLPKCEAIDRSRATAAVVIFRRENP
ncbi:hypothetical protein GRI89_07075 [Altererythrobacter salegens]|uniref:Uncharacterized protein n=1 Tax=Croceibacterium salegens TaxID=1737568 RepID=A0A6I4STK5_9SPHN|nr:hypothetical protein [Croceibacterium salegens]MXO59301.1 hypothetical protein [Croceibacterium salegens]